MCRLECRHIYTPEMANRVVTELIKEGTLVTAQDGTFCDSRVPILLPIEKGTEIFCVGPYDRHCPDPESATIFEYEPHDV